MGLAQEDPFLGALAGFELRGVDFLDLVVFKVNTRALCFWCNVSKEISNMQTYHDEVVETDSSTKRNYLEK